MHASEAGDDHKGQSVRRYRRMYVYESRLVPELVLLALEPAEFAPCKRCEPDLACIAYSSSLQRVLGA